MIIELGQIAFDLRSVYYVGEVGGDMNWERYSVYFDGGLKLQIHETRASVHRGNGNIPLPQMERKKFVELWKKQDGEIVKVPIDS